MNLANYTIQTPQGPVTAKEIIALLDPADPLHAAHIGEVFTLCATGMRHSNQDIDVLSAALTAARTFGQAVPEHAALWVARWSNCMSHVFTARAWAIA